MLVHSDGGSYKPLNWMSPPCRLEESPGTWRVVNKAGEELRITLEEVLHDSATNSGSTRGCRRTASRRTCRNCSPRRYNCWARAGDWSAGSTRPRSARSTCMCRDEGSAAVAVEIKRRGDIDGVEQLTRYLELLNRDPVLSPVRGVFAAQEIRPQARVLAEDRGIRCVTLDYDAMRGAVDDSLRLF